MRPVICKCPNHTGCLVGYHGDDIEIAAGTPAVCPECGTNLKPAPKPRSDTFYRILNLIGIAALAAAVWFVWPTVVRLWHKATTPPARATPAKK